MTQNGVPIQNCCGTRIGNHCLSYQSAQCLKGHVKNKDVRCETFLEWEIQIKSSIELKLIHTNGSSNTKLLQSTRPVLFCLVAFAVWWLRFTLHYFAHADSLLCQPPTQNRILLGFLWNITVPMSGFERLKMYHTCTEFRLHQ